MLASSSPVLYWFAADLLHGPRAQEGDEAKVKVGHTEVKGGDRAFMVNHFLLRNTDLVELAWARTNKQKARYHMAFVAINNTIASLMIKDVSFLTSHLLERMRLAICKR